MIRKSVKISAAVMAAVGVMAAFAILFCTNCAKSPTDGGDDDDSTYVVTFDINGGSGTTPSAKTVIRGEAITLPNGSGLTKDGHNFGGWNTDSGGNGTTYIPRTGSSYTPTGNITLYAKWYASGEVVYGASVTYGGETYETVVIGDQTWFARNLNYDVPDDTTDRCYRDSAEYCGIYGRMYTWNTAMTACPAGWRLPTDEDWMELFNYVDPDGQVVQGQNDQTSIGLSGQKLKAKTGWNPSVNQNLFDATDEYGFAGLPGGRRTSGASGSWQNIGDRSNWWAASEGTAAQYGTTAIAYSFRSSGNSVWRFDNNSVVDLHSVRCLMDD